MIFLATAMWLAAAEPKLPPGVNCELIRALVVQYGYTKAVYWARLNGYSWAQIYEAKKCLR